MDKENLDNLQAKIEAREAKKKKKPKMKVSGGNVKNLQKIIVGKSDKNS